MKVHFTKLLLAGCSILAAHTAQAQSSHSEASSPARQSGHAASAEARNSSPGAQPASAEKDGAAMQLKVDEAGTIVGTDTINIPLSGYLSPEGKAAYAEFLNHQFPEAHDINEYRRMLDAYILPTVNKWKARYPVDVETKTLAGVTVDVITPKAGIAQKNRNRILMVLHGGAFMVGEGLGGQNEAIPIAGRGGIRAVSVRYRQGPEHRFPAASEDVAAVYAELLKQYRPENIGIEGCSAGGILTGQSMVWFQQHNLPRPGAIGIFCAGLDFSRIGDAQAISNLLNGKPTSNIALPQMPYFIGADMNDSRVSPAASPEALAKFPPTLFLTGTRDLLMSDAINGHAKLLKAGTESHLYITEGWGHGTPWNALEAPEAADTFDVIWKFFDSHLGTRAR
jgi:monoterpene epsilon-lactone hydrolase